MKIFVNYKYEEENKTDYSANTILFPENLIENPIEDEFNIALDISHIEFLLENSGYKLVKI